MATEGGGLQYYFMLRGAQEGYSGQQVLNLLQEFNLGMRRQDFYRLWGTARSAVSEAGQEPTRPADQVPTLAEMGPPVPTRNSQAILQTTRLIYREQMTGQIRTVYHSITSEQGMTRQEAVNAAIAAYAAHSEEYQTTLVAAYHSSAVQLVPVGAL
jgi:hypothetical protein